MQSREFYGYTVFEDGAIINRKTQKEITKRIHNGRYEVQLTVDYKTRKNFIVPRIMCWLFVEKFDISDDNLCVSFKDNNKLNITLDNLYLTERKNLIQGEGHKSISKLTDKQMEEIKKAYNSKNKIYSNQYTKTGVSLNELAKKYNVTKGEIWQIVSGKARNPEKYKLK